MSPAASPPPGSAGDLTPAVQAAEGNADTIHLPQKTD